MNIIRFWFQIYYYNNPCTILLPISFSLLHKLERVLKYNGQSKS